MNQDNENTSRHQRYAEAERRLRDYLATLSFVTPTIATRIGPNGRPSAAGTDSVNMASLSRVSPEPTLAVNVNLHGGTIVLDNERQLRALAKEIKRLITEDTRRGIAL